MVPAALLPLVTIVLQKANGKRRVESIHPTNHTFLVPSRQWRIREWNQGEFRERWTNLLDDWVLFSPHRIASRASTCPSSSRRASRSKQTKLAKNGHTRCYVGNVTQTSRPRHRPPPTLTLTSSGGGCWYSAAVTRHGLNEGQDGRRSDNTAVSMRQVLLLNVNATGPHWYLCTRRNEEQIPATKRRSPPRTRTLPLLSATPANTGVAHEEADSGMPRVLIRCTVRVRSNLSGLCTTVEPRGGKKERPATKDERGAEKKREEIALSRHRTRGPTSWATTSRGKIAKVLLPRFAEFVPPGLENRLINDHISMFYQWKGRLSFEL